MQTGRLQLRGEMYRTVNTVYFDSAAAVDDEFSSLDGGGEVLDDESCFATTIASAEWSEAVVPSLQGRSTSTHRFFFDLGSPVIRSSVLPTTTTSATPPPKPNPDDDGQRASKSLAEGSIAVVK
jgi:hypothetical protein